MSTARGTPGVAQTPRGTAAILAAQQAAQQEVAQPSPPPQQSGPIWPGALPAYSSPAPTPEPTSLFRRDDTSTPSTPNTSLSSTRPSRTSSSRTTAPGTPGVAQTPRGTAEILAAQQAALQPQQPTTRYVTQISPDGGPMSVPVGQTTFQDRDTYTVTPSLSRVQDTSTRLLDSTPFGTISHSPSRDISQSGLSQRDTSQRDTLQRDTVTRYTDTGAPYTELDSGPTYFRATPRESLLYTPATRQPEPSQPRDAPIPTLGQTPVTMLGTKTRTDREYEPTLDFSELRSVTEATDEEQQKMLYVDTSDDKLGTLLPSVVRDKHDSERRYLFDSDLFTRARLRRDDDGKLEFLGVDYKEVDTTPKFWLDFLGQRRAQEDIIETYLETDQALTDVKGGIKRERDAQISQYFSEIDSLTPEQEKIEQELNIYKQQHQFFQDNIQPSLNVMETITTDTSNVQYYITQQGIEELNKLNKREEELFSEKNILSVGEDGTTYLTDDAYKQYLQLNEERDKIYTQHQRDTYDDDVITILIPEAHQLYQQEQDRIESLKSEHGFDFDEFVSSSERLSTDVEDFNKRLSEVESRADRIKRLESEYLTLSGVRHDAQMEYQDKLNEILGMDKLEVKKRQAEQDMRLVRDELSWRESPYKRYQAERMNIAQNLGFGAVGIARSIGRFVAVEPVRKIGDDLEGVQDLSLSEQVKLYGQVPLRYVTGQYHARSAYDWTSDDPRWDTDVLKGAASTALIGFGGLTGAASGVVLPKVKTASALSKGLGTAGKVALGTGLAATVAVPPTLEYMSGARSVRDLKAQQKQLQELYDSGEITQEYYDTYSRQIAENLERTERDRVTGGEAIGRATQTLGEMGTVMAAGVTASALARPSSTLLRTPGTQDATLTRVLNNINIPKGYTGRWTSPMTTRQVPSRISGAPSVSLRGQPSYDVRYAWQTGRTVQHRGGDVTQIPGLTRQRYDFLENPAGIRNLGKQIQTRIDVRPVLDKSGKKVGETIVRTREFGGNRYVTTHRPGDEVATTRIYDSQGRLVRTIQDAPIALGTTLPGAPISVTQKWDASIQPRKDLLYQTTGQRSSLNYDQIINRKLRLRGTGTQYTTADRRTETDWAFGRVQEGVPGTTETRVISHIRQKPGISLTDGTFEQPGLRTINKITKDGRLIIATERTQPTIDTTRFIDRGTMYYTYDPVPLTQRLGVSTKLGNLGDRTLSAVDDFLGGLKGMGKRGSVAISRGTGQQLDLGTEPGTLAQTVQRQTTGLKPKPSVTPSIQTSTIQRTDRIIQQVPKLKPDGTIGAHRPTGLPTFRTPTTTDYGLIPMVGGTTATIGGLQYEPKISGIGDTMPAISEMESVRADPLSRILTSTQTPLDVRTGVPTATTTYTGTLPLVSTATITATDTRPITDVVSSPPPPISGPTAPPPPPPPTSLLGLPLLGALPLFGVGGGRGTPTGGTRFTSGWTIENPIVDYAGDFFNRLKTKEFFVSGQPRSGTSGNVLDRMFDDNMSRGRRFRTMYGGLPLDDKSKSSPTMSVPTMSVPTMSVPTPSVRTSSVRTPSVRTPSVRTPSVRTSSVRTPSVRTPSVRTSSVRTPSAQTQRAQAQRAQAQRVQRAQTQRVQEMTDTGTTKRKSTVSKVLNNVARMVK